MVSITEQIALQRAKQGVGNGQPVQPGGASNAPAAVGLNAIAAAVAKQRAEAESKPPASPAPVATPVVGPVPVASRPAGIAVGIPVKLGTVVAPTPGPTPAPVPARRGNLVLPTPSGIPAPAVQLSPSDAIAQLADMDVSHIDARPAYVQPASRVPTYTLPEAHMPPPDRGIVGELSDGQAAFIQQLNQVRNIFHDAELFSQVVRIIMQELQLNPEFEELVQDEDVHFMLRGMREAMGVARVQAASRKRVAGGATKARASKSSEKLDALADTAAALGFSFSDD